MSAISYIWKNYNLSVILFALFVVAWILQTYAGWIEFQSEQQAHQEIPQLLGNSGYAWIWIRTTMENWQSEFLQLLAFVVLTATFIHRGSPESKDGDEEAQAALKRIERDLQQIRAILYKDGKIESK